MLGLIGSADKQVSGIGVFFHEKKLQGREVFFMKKKEVGTTKGNRLPRAGPKQTGALRP
jgi:hypothetical protein